jgi:hypothetical protein
MNTGNYEAPMILLAYGTVGFNFAIFLYDNNYGILHVFRQINNF